MVIDLAARRAERERRQLEHDFNPGPTRDYLEVTAAYLVLAAAFGVVAWVILMQPR